MQDYEKLGVFYLGREVDAAGQALTDHPLLYDARQLTTHAVCVGMTGSGKTGLCLSLLEEAAIDGIPALCIDPKGDLGNLLLAFPRLAAADFQPWVDPAEAQRKGLPVEQFAEQTANTWRSGLAEWDQPPERISRYLDAVDLAIYTPGAETGVPLSVLRAFSPPSQALEDAGILRESIGAVVSGLLTLLKRDADPLKSRDYLLLATIVEHYWREGRAVELPELITAVQKPPFDKVGAFDLETFFPAAARLELAMAINMLLASPGFSVWLQGEALDMQRLLFTPAGKPRIAIVSIAHLPDAERMFVVTLLLNEMLSWMRRQSGTGSLRAILYMDEIFGYFPPTANPPSKLPMLTLLKQARAYGLGCVLATQNPVDLDYKGLANTGTWFIGRLQTERDKLRVLEGLESALPGSAGFDRAQMERTLSNLPPRTFLLRSVHENAPVLFKSRWALSYLRGPLTGPQIAVLMKGRKQLTQPAAAVMPSTAVKAKENRARPSVPAQVAEYFWPAPGEAAASFVPKLLGTAKVHFVDSGLDVDEWRTVSYLAPLSAASDAAQWSEASTIESPQAKFAKNPPAQAAYDELPAAALRAASYGAWGKQLIAHVYETVRAQVLVCDALKMTSNAGENAGDFRARLALKAREQRDAALDALRRKYAPQLATLEDRARRAEERAERERSQLSQQKMQTMVSIGASLLGAFLGKRAVSVTNVTRVASAARGAGRIGRERQDVEHADENIEAVKARLADLQARFDEDRAALESGLDVNALALREVTVSPRKSDLAVQEVALVWVDERVASWAPGSRMKD